NEATNLLRLELAHHLKNVREIPDLTSSQIRNIIRKSELPSTIAQITSPQYLVHYTTESKFSFRAQIYQQTALFYQLGTILNKWTPLEVKETWKKNAPMKIKYFPSGLGNLMLPTGAAGFFKLLAQKPILPLKAFPFVVLFLIGGESNFDFWWSHSIAPALDYFGYKIESSPPKGLFSKLIGYLKPQSAMSKIEKDGLTESTLAYTPHGLIMAKILKNSVEYFKFEHEVSSYMKKFHIPHPEDAENMSLIDYYNNCAICCTKPPNERCTTVLQVQFLNQLELEKRFPGLIHGGVTSVPDPVQIGAGTMYDYKDLRLHKVCEDQQKIASCGQHRWIITTGDPTHPRQKEDKVEMVLFDAFSNSCLKRMIFNFNHSTEVAALQRQGRVSGDMIPFGTRVPKGGAPADGLRPFEGINATTTTGVDEFFAQAENAMAYDKVAKYLDPDLYHEIQRRTIDSEKLGRIGGTVYSCHNYMAIQHLENTDACRSFCSQLELIRNHQYEMAFVYSQMGYWIETESNTFWTFDASLVHGTMLPAEKTAAQMRTRTRLRDGQPAGGGGDVPERTTPRIIEITMVVTSVEGAPNANAKEEAYLHTHPSWALLLQHTFVYARVSPLQKELILTSLKNLGYITLVAGDGTNDVGALKQAHIGVAILDGTPEDPQKIAERQKVERVKQVYESQLKISARFHQPPPPVPVGAAEGGGVPDGGEEEEFRWRNSTWLVSQTNGEDEVPIRL
ncbi:MAG: hypothetical protein NXY57DRAFT_1044469, partial [Lentinula lateritia]